MPLAPLEKDDLQERFLLLCGLDEPESLVAALKRACEIKAGQLGSGKLGLEEAKRWGKVADALDAVEQELAKTELRQKQFRQAGLAAVKCELDQPQESKPEGSTGD